MKKDTLLDEIIAFYEQQKDNAEDIKQLGCLEFRMWLFIERIVKKYLPERRVKC